jgi:serine phosphatase RsbU (regulator of sigma subunit)
MPLAEALSTPLSTWKSSRKGASEYGDQRLQQALRNSHRLAPEAILQHIVSTVEQFASGAPQHDDMTMVVFKVE